MIGITAYGRCIGLTRYRSGVELPRITLASNIFARGENVVKDVLLHELIHAHLFLLGCDTEHNSAAWCEEIVRLSPSVLGHPIKAEPVKPRRVDGKVKLAPLDWHLTQDQLARWPGSLRGHEFGAGRRLSVDSY